MSKNMNVKLSKDHVHYSVLREVDRVSVLEAGWSARWLL